MTISIENRVAIVTGATRGLGRSYARALAARGARVVIADLGEEAETTEASDSRRRSGNFCEDLLKRHHEKGH